jgi:hypothetical protein
MSAGAEPNATARAGAGIWLFALGYFLAYVPYAMLTKAISDGSLPGIDARVGGLALVPVTTAVSAAGMLAFLAASGLWRRARRLRVPGGIEVPFPRASTWVSGACTALIVVTTTLAYTFDGTSIVAMMLLMRGGVLVIAPMVDAVSGRRVRWFSWVALVISLCAFAAALAPSAGSIAIGLWAGLDAGIYLAAYFARLRLMSGSAKRDRDANMQFFVEEQLVATPLALVGLSIAGALLAGEAGEALSSGALAVASSAAMPWAVVIGLCSQATGIFGALVLLDARENSFSVPVNRASSVLAGVVATLALAAWLGANAPSGSELVGAGLVVGAIAVLWLGPRVGRAE